MLDRAVAVQQLGAHAADVRPHGFADHLPEPSAIEDLDVVVQEEQHLAGRGLHAGVVDGRKIEGPRHPQHADARVRGQFGEEGQRGRLDAVVVEDEDFEVRIVGLAQQAVQAGPHQVGAIARRHEHADPWRGAGQRAADMVDELGDRRGQHLGRHARLPERRFSRHPPGRRRIGLDGLPRVARIDDRRDLPVVQHRRNMAHLAAGQRHGHPAVQVVAGGRLEFGAKASGRQDVGAPHHAQAVQQVEAELRLRIPCRLEARLASQLALCDPVLVRIDDGRIGPFGERELDRRNGLRSEAVAREDHAEPRLGRVLERELLQFEPAGRRTRGHQPHVDRIANEQERMADRFGARRVAGHHHVEAVAQLCRERSQRAVQCLVAAAVGNGEGQALAVRKILQLRAKRRLFCLVAGRFVACPRAVGGVGEGREPARRGPLGVSRLIDRQIFPPTLQRDGTTPGACRHAEPPINSE